MKLWMKHHKTTGQLSSPETEADEVLELLEEKEAAERRDGSGTGADGREPVIHLEHIVKRFNIGTENELEVLHGITMDIYDGDFVCIVGESGSGKSTLMNQIGLLDHPTEGSYLMRGEDVSEASEDELAEIRNREIGFVFQTYNLIARTTALENVAMPMLYAGVPVEERMERAAQLLEMVGMGDRMDHTPAELSGGQQQRVAIARAMANDPSIILADEPTGALDSQTSRTVMNLFHQLHEEQNRTIVMITHSTTLAEEAERVLTLVDGRIVGERRGSKADREHEFTLEARAAEKAEQEKEAPAEKETAKAAEQKAPEQEAAKQAAPDQDAPAAAPEKEKKQSAPAAPAAQKKEETGKEENREEAKPKQEEAPHLTPEELRIRTLEQQRQKRIEQLRAKYTGNPGVETQIDNYIARCERTADQVVSEFTSYIASVQNYAAQTSFTGTEDPNYKAMLSDIQEAADSLGSQMDQVAQSADENAQNAKDAGIREPYVERLVRLMDRLDKKYEAFFVSMGGGSVLNEIRYHRPEEISQIFRKWRNVRYSLPSWIEQSEGEIEEAAKDEIQKRILAARDAIPALEAELEEREAAAKAFEEAIPEKESEYDASLRSVEDRRKALELQKEEKRRTYHEKLGSMQQELEEREAEEERLKAHLEKTLSINVGKKRDLQTKLTNVRNDIEERHGRIRELQEQGTQIGTAEDQELAALEEQEAKLQKERAALSTELEAQKQETEKIRSQIAESHRAIEEGEEEFRHVHENYLLGKYDRAPE